MYINFDPQHWFMPRIAGAVGLGEEAVPISRLQPKKGGSGCITLLPSKSFILSEEMVFNLYDYCYLLHVSIFRLIRVMAQSDVASLDALMWHMLALHMLDHAPASQNLAPSCACAAKLVQFRACTNNVHLQNISRSFAHLQSILTIMDSWCSHLKSS